MSYKTRLAILLLISVSSPTLKAQTDWSMCQTPVITREKAIDYSLFGSEVEADRVVSSNRDFLLFEGNVEFQRHDQSLSADVLKLYRDPERFQASGNINFADELYRLNASHIEFNSDLETGLFSQVDFQLYDNHLRGNALKLQQLDADRRELHDVSYTTCDPGKNHWSISADKLEFDQSKGFGAAHNAVIRISRVPVFYFPWFRFPITDQRMSGLLTPTLSQSNADGTTVSIPVYWNQAPNYDMTITPVSYWKRGLQLNTENRYLLGDHSGTLNLSWLDDDKFNHERWYRKWQHQAGDTSFIKTDLLFQKVSDSDFLEDFNQLDGIDDVDYLKSSITFSSQLQEWDIGLLFEKYQTINLDKSIASRPYKRLPSLTINKSSSALSNEFYTEWENEWVSFDKEDSITGERLHIAPVLHYPIENDAYFIKPALQLDFRQYQLDNNTLGDNEIDSSIPLFSVDSGLIFERLAGTTGQWMQTLEPRLYLLYVPHEEQNDIPDFDTALLSESFDNLFVNNRFSGADRIGDSQQISLGITSRLLDSESGRELVKASIGQAYYDEPRKVSLNNSIDERDKSSLITSINFKPREEWEILLNSVYDQPSNSSRQSDVSFRRHLGKQVFNLEYHLRRNSSGVDTLEQSTLSFVYPLSTTWSSFGKYQYSMRKKHPVNNLFGFAYESCCWGFKMLYEEDTDKDFEQTDRAIYFELTLKGLSSAGRDINSLLEDGILGYQPVF